MALVVKNASANATDARDLGSIPGVGRSPGEGNGNLLQHSSLLKSHTQKSLVGYSSWNYEDLDVTEYLFGESNGTPLQYSCLENPMDGGAWWAAVHRVEKSQRHNLATKQPQRVQGGLHGNEGGKCSRTVMIHTRPRMKGIDLTVVETQQWNLLWWRGKGRLQNNTEMWTWVNKRTQSMQSIVHILEESTCSNLSYFWFSRVNLQSWRQWYSKLSPSGNMAFTQSQILHSIILTLFHQLQKKLPASKIYYWQILAVHIHL